MESTITSHRNAYFDILRGLAIIMVVGIHSFTPPQLNDCNSGIYDWYETFIRQIIQFPVPLFVAISGYFLAKKKLETKDECKRFWKKQIPKVYIPCLVWMLPLFLSSVLKRGIDVLCVEVAKYFLCGFRIYYFILAIIQCYLLLPLIQRTNIRRLLTVLVAINIIHMLAYSYILYELNVTLPLIVYAASFTLLGVYFVLGIYLSQHDRGYSLTLPILGIVAGLVLQMLETYYININFEGGFGIKVSSLLYSYSSISFLFSSKVEKWVSNHANCFTRLLNKIGNVSFGVYLTHSYFIMILNQVHAFDNFFVKWIIATLVTVLFVMTSKRVMPVFTEKYLGFR